MGDYRKMKTHVSATHDDTDDSCVGDMLDPCGVCITKGQMRDGTLVNRMLMCLFAVVMLWASSFQTAVFIANSSISSPLFEAVTDSCRAAYDLSKAEKADYVEASVGATEARGPLACRRGV